MLELKSAAISLFIVAVTGAGCASQHNVQNDGSAILIDGAVGLDNWNRVGDANWRVHPTRIWTAAFARVGRSSNYLSSRGNGSFAPPGIGVRSTLTVIATST